MNCHCGYLRPNLPFEEYASNPEAMYAAREDTNEALRLV